MPFEYPGWLSRAAPGFFMPGCFCCAGGAVTTRKFDSSGNLLWTADHGAQSNSIALDSSGNVFTVGNSASGTVIRKYDTDGVELGFTLSDGFSTALGDIAIDSADNVHVAHGLSGGVALRKYDSSGSLLWTAAGTGGKGCGTLDVDSSGNVYAGFTSDGTQDIEMYDSSGSSQWTAHTGAANNVLGINEVGVDRSSGDLYVVGTVGLRKYDNSGAFQWSASHGDTLHGAFYYSGHVYVCGNRSAGSSNKTMRKYDSSGSLVWSYDDAVSFVLCLALNSSGDIANGGDSAGVSATRVASYDSTPTQQWTAVHGSGTLQRVLGIVIDDSGNVYMTGGRVT